MQKNSDEGYLNELNEKIEQLRTENDELTMAVAEYTAMQQALRDEMRVSKHLQTENDELTEIHNAQAICAEQFAAAMAENVLLREAVSTAIKYRTAMGGSFTQWFDAVQTILDKALNSTPQTAKLQATLDTPVENGGNDG